MDRHLEERPITLVGEIFIDLFDENGQIKDRRYIKNLITTAGFNLVSNLLGQASPRPAAANYIAIGSGTVGAAVGDTALGFELPNARLSGTYTLGSNSYTMVASFPPGTGTGGVTESGMLNASSTGTLLNRQTFGVVTKGASDTLQCSWSISLS